MRFTLLALAAVAAALATTAVPSGPWPTAPHFFPQYPTRRVTVLNGTWAFGLTSLDVTTASYAALLVGATNLTAVPSSYDVAPAAVKGVRSGAFYLSAHACTPGTTALLRFYAVNFFARVFVDGVELGNHTAGPYTPFSFVAPQCGAGGSRVLGVMVSNVFDRVMAPTATGGDFYFYGGIIRPIVVSELPAAAYWLDRVEPLTVDAAAGAIDVRVVLGGAAPPSVSLRLAFNGGAAAAPVAAPVVGGVATLSRVSVPDAKLWSVGAPNLYTLTVADAGSGDALLVRSGLRVVGAAPLGANGSTRLTINGAAVKLKGFNRHTMWPDTGAAVTPEQEARDMAVVLGVNANYIRGGHYPQSQHWLDLCDENGVALWEEALGPGVSTKDIQDPYFMANQEAAVASMVATSFAHPSVILHGFFNEGPSNDAAACVGYEALAAAVHSRVGTPAARLVTWASDKTTGDVCLDHADVVSFNSYPGWYISPGNISVVGPFWRAHVDWAAATFPGKPFTVSETGGGGIYELVNDTAPEPGPFWSTHYQRSLLTADATTLLADGRVSGLSLWLLTDFKVDDESCGQCDYLPHPDNLTVPWTCGFIRTDCGRPNGENHKGVVDWWRRPKETYATMSDLYAAA